MFKTILVAILLAIFITCFVACMIEAGVYAYKWIDTKITNRFNQGERIYNKGDDSLCNHYLFNMVGAIFFCTGAIILFLGYLRG